MSIRSHWKLYVAILAVAVGSTVAFMRNHSDTFENRELVPGTNWEVNLPSTASVVSDHKSALAFSCTETMCGWVMLVPGHSCAPKAESPVLVKATVGGAILRMVCVSSDEKGSGLLVHPSSNADLMTLLLNGSTELSIVLPLGKASLEVHKFDITGAQKALYMLMPPTVEQSNEPTRGTIDPSKPTI